jgi:HD-like signal output (HDOD) protein
MRNWFNWVRGTSSTETAAVPAAPVRRPARPRPRPVVSMRHESPAPESRLLAQDIAFLEGLAYPPERKSIDEFPKTDQFFLGGISKRLHMRELEMPVLPEVAIRLSEMLRQTDLPVASYVALVNRDSSLSVEVLKAANAAVYGAVTTTSLHEAVMRIGLSRLHSVLMLAHLKARILKGSPLFRRNGELLLELSLPLGFLASKLARVQGAADVRFVRGMLMHVEHIIILGALGDISRERRTGLAPSVEALHQAFVRFGPDIREAAASAWKLSEMLVGEDTDNLREEYEGLRQALVCRWLGRPLPVLPGVDDRDLEETMLHIQERVLPSPDTATA